jgi:ABC-type multidrug transport system ATPase subunit
MLELRIDKLSKRYPNGTQALSDVSLTVGQGMFGLLGPNGAGKSTLMRTIATLQEPDTGTLLLGDIDARVEKDAMRRVLGYLPQEFGLYPKVSAEDLLDHLAVLKGFVRRAARRAMVQALLEKTNLAHVRDKPLGTFSGGMKQRFGIAQALIGSPRLVIVDEPTAGLDPEERVRFHNLLAEIGENVIVILSTHIVSDVSDLCSSMAILHEGRVKLACDPAAALERVRGRVWAKTIDKGELGAQAERHPIISTRLFAGKTNIHVFGDARPDPSFHEVAPDLEDVYFATVRGLVASA